MMVIHSGTSNITNNVNTLQKIRNVINAIKENTAQKNVPCSKFSIQDLVTFTEEILNRKVHFLCSRLLLIWNVSNFLSLSLYLFDVIQAAQKT